VSNPKTKFQNRFKCYQYLIRRSR